TRRAESRREKPHREESHDDHRHEPRHAQHQPAKPKQQPQRKPHADAAESEKPTGFGDYVPAFLRRGRREAPPGPRLLDAPPARLMETTRSRVGNVYTFTLSILAAVRVRRARWCGRSPTRLAPRWRRGCGSRSRA